MFGNYELLFFHLYIRRPMSLTLYQCKCPFGGVRDFGARLYAKQKARLIGSHFVRRLVEFEGDGAKSLVAAVESKSRTAA